MVQLKTGIFLLSLLEIICAGCQPETPQQTVLTGLVDAREADVVPLIPGRVETLAVREGDHVEKGQLVATLKLNTLQARLAQADSVVDVAKSELDLTRKGTRKELIDMAKTSVRTAQSELETAKKMLERGQELFREKVIGSAELDAKTLARDLAQNHLEMERKALKILKSGARPEQLESATSVLQGAESMRESIASMLEEKNQTATSSGEVAKIYLQEGEIASIAYPIITIVDLEDQWVTFSIREDLLKEVKKGDKTTFYLPALDLDVEATVAHIAPLGDFATWRATSDSNSFDLKSFEVTLRPLAPVERMRPGMTARWTPR